MVDKCSFRIQPDRTCAEHVLCVAKKTATVQDKVPRGWNRPSIRPVYTDEHLRIVLESRSLVPHIQIHLRVAVISLLLPFLPYLHLATSNTTTATVVQSKAAELTPPINISLPYGVLGSAV